MYRNIINKKIKNYCNNNNIENADIGFMKFINEMFYNGSPNEIEDCEININENIIDGFIVDGQSDKQIDLIQIEEDEITTIRIIQVKKTRGFESNIVILIRNGLDWIFNRDESEVLQLKNTSFKDRILEVRDILENESKKNIYIDVCYVTLGNKKDIRIDDEINSEIKKLIDEYSELFENFRFELYGAREISNYIDLMKNKEVDAKLNIIYDANVASFIEKRCDEIKSLVCNIKASELIKIFSTQKSEYLFEQNVRKYLEDRSKVNSSIINTASGEDSEYFWALNNGVTIICDKYDLKAFGGKASIEMENLQVINGCQTTMALFAASKKGTLKENTSLLLRVHETKDDSVIEKIILSTNNQNPINPRDLSSNSHEQIELQKYFFEIYNVVYQRKRNDIRDVNGILVNKKDIVANDKVGQAALACIKCMPSTALGSKGRVFSQDKDIFSKNKESIALSLFLHEKVLEYSKSSEIKDDNNMVSIMKFGRFHITYLLYKKYSVYVDIDLNKKIKYNDIDLTNDMFLAAYLLKEELTTEQKLNLLSYFKSKESTKKIDDIYKKICKVNNSLELLIKRFGEDNINIKEICRDDMTIEVESSKIRLRPSGKIDIYKRFDYVNDQDEEKETNKELMQEKESFVNSLIRYLEKEPDINYPTSPIMEEFIGYFDIDIDEELVNKFIDISV